MDYTEMGAGEMYQAVGGDASKWATAFTQITKGRTLDEDDMLGWFANAMQAALDFQHGQPILCGDHAQFLLDRDSGIEAGTDETP